jgi:hypothetical protein
MQLLPGENSARTFVNAVRQAVRAITNSLGTQDIAVDVLAATVLINGVSAERATFVSSLRATNVLESLKFEELGTKLIDEGARTLGSRDMDSSKALSASAPPSGKKPNDAADKQAPACPLCSLLSARIPGLHVARVNHPMHPSTCWMAREAERYFKSDRPHRSDKQQQQQSLDVSATAVRQPTSAQQQAHGRRTVVADAVVASGRVGSLSRDEYVQRRLAAEAEYDALSASAAALSATGPRARAGIPATSTPLPTDASTWPWSSTPMTQSGVLLSLRAALSGPPHSLPPLPQKPLRRLSYGTRPVRTA